MPMRIAATITLTDEERTTLIRWARGRRTEARLVQRAKIILAAEQGNQNKQIASDLGCTRRTVGTWRNRFVKQRLAGLQKDAPRSGRKPAVRQVKEVDIIRKTTQEKPPDATHWSTRTMAEAVGVSRSTVQRVWRDNGLKPHRTKTFKVSNDPKFAEKLVDVVGLYLNPPEQALVLSCDEKTQIQALDRTQKNLPMFPGRCETMTHDYKRNGTTTLFAALSVTDGTIVTQCQQRHRHQEWIKFLKTIDRETVPEFDLHLIVDSHVPQDMKRTPATHKHPKVKAWLKRHPRFHIHFIPTSSSWLNVIERWFAEITNKRIRRGVFRSVKELVQAIEDYVDRYNESPQGYNWTKSAEEILEKVTRAKAALDKCLSE
jgi:transposase